MRTLMFLLVAGALIVGTSVATAPDAKADVTLGFGIGVSAPCCGPTYYAPAAYVPTYSYYPGYAYPTHYPSYYGYGGYKSYRPYYGGYYRPYYRPYVSTGIYLGGHRHYYGRHRYYGHRHYGHYRGGHYRGHRHGIRRGTARRR